MPLTDDVVVRRRFGVQETTSRKRRSQILDAAASVFAELGFNGASLRGISLRAGISLPGLLHHYPNKTALLEAVLDDRLGGKTPILPLDAADGELFIRSLIERAMRDAREPTTIGLVTLLSAEALRPDHPAHGYFQNWHSKARSLITQAFTDLNRRGLYKAAVPPEVAAVHVAAMRDGLNAHWLLDPDGIELVASLRSLLAAYVDLDL